MRVRCKRSYYIITDTNDVYLLDCSNDIKLRNSHIKLVFEKGLYYELHSKVNQTNSNICYTISTPLHHENIILYFYTFDLHFDGEVETRQEMINQLLE